MKSQFLSVQGTLSGVGRETVFWWAVLLFCFSIPLPQTVSTYLLAFLFIFSFAIPASRRWKALFSNAWDIGLYMLILSVGLIYTEQFEQGYKVLETSLSFLALPFVLFKVKELGSAHLQKIFNAFTLGLIFVCAVYLGHATWLFVQGDGSQSFLSAHLTGIISNSHPTYLAYYIIFSIGFILNGLYYEESKFHPAVNVLLLVFLFTMLMLTAGQTTYISLLLVFAFFILKFLSESDISRQKVFAFCIVCFLLVSLFATNIIANRSSIESSGSDSWDRIALWQSGLNATPDLIWGSGTGDYKKILNEYFVTHNMAAFADSNFNSHNQFIQLLFSNGIIGVFAVMLLLGRPLYMSVRDQNVLGILTFFPFIIYGMTEVFLGRYQGVVFFVILHQCFIICYQNRKPAFSLKDL